jgi:hypothetical protein
LTETRSNQCDPTINCSSESEISDYESWELKGSFSQEAIAHRLKSEPFIKNTDNVCLLQCGHNYWSDFKSETDQKCVSNNCKTTLVLQATDQCETCWTEEDISAYEQWPARASYPLGLIQERNRQEPFVLKDNQCVLQCKADNQIPSKVKNPFNQNCWVGLEEP